MKTEKMKKMNKEKIKEVKNEKMRKDKMKEEMNKLTMSYLSQLS